MNIEKERAKAKKWEKIRAKGKLYLVCRVFVIGAVLGLIYPAIVFLLLKNTSDVVKIAPIWMISFGLLYAIVGFFAWNSREKQYQKFIAKNGTQ